MHRLEDRPEHPPEPEERYDDYFEIHAYETFIVSRAVAMQIERVLDSLPPPRWIEFEDLTGARHRMLASHIGRISESTAAQRALERGFHRARRLEEKQDRRSWEDDD